MYLVDTSVWIDYFRKIENPSTELFASILDKRLPFGITGVIYQEILQGATTERDFHQLKQYLSTQRFFHPQDEVSTHESAAKIYYQCRRKGITIRSTVDCFIAQIAIEHNLVLLHSDQDYDRIRSIVSELSIAVVPATKRTPTSIA